MEAPTYLPKTTLQVDSFQSLCELVRLRVIRRKEIYTLTVLKAAYESLKTEDCPILRVGDIKNGLSQVFPTEITLSPLPDSRTRNKQEYVIPAGESLPSEIVSTAYHGGGILKTALLRASATRLHHEIKTTCTRREWPPTPQDMSKIQILFMLTRLISLLGSLNHVLPLAKMA